MRIKESLIKSFKSPFFNLLAIANLILIAMVFSVPFPTFTTVGSVTFALNLPALAVSRILTGPLLQNFILVPPLVYLQWILIGAFAKLIASKCSPMGVDLR